MSDPAAERNPWVTTGSRVVYENPWIRVREDAVLNPAGNPGIYGVVEYKNIAVGVVPVDDQGHTWLVGQYRYTLGSYEWEIPEGGCAPDEAPEQCARRELREETGLLARELEPLLGWLQLSNSVSNERARLFLATGIETGQAAPEETEQLAVRRLPLSEAVAMAERGEIHDAMSVIGLLAAGQWRANQKKSPIEVS
jgi:8-oxo-dGTP pyrophosphatase MutT (NUDIX family)